MKIDTKYFGEMDVAENEIVHFPEPLPGFDHCSKYVIIRFDDEDDSLLCLQSLDEPSLAFVLINPFYLIGDYTPLLNSEDMQALQIEQDTLLAYYAIAVPHEDWLDSTVNLRCPIAVNPEKRIGRQLLMEDTNYSMRHPIKSSVEKGA